MRLSSRDSLFGSLLLNLVLNKRDPNNESLDDNLIDIANYAVMALLVRGKEWGK